MYIVYTIYCILHIVCIVLLYSDGQTFIVVNLKEEWVYYLFAPIFSHHYSDADVDDGVVVVGVVGGGDDDEDTCTAVILQIR